MSSTWSTHVIYLLYCPTIWREIEELEGASEQHLAHTCYISVIYCPTIRREIEELEGASEQHLVRTCYTSICYISVILSYYQDQSGSLARSCNVATDRLVYQDVCGLSATEPCRVLGFGAALSPRMLGCC